MLAFPVSELYFLIAKFLSGGPLKETAKVNMLKLLLFINIVVSKILIQTLCFTDFAKRVAECRGEFQAFPSRA